MMQSAYKPIRIGYAGGQPKRLNERVIDGQWVQYLGEYSELVKITPYSFYKLFGGTVEKWMQKFPHSLDELSEGLADLCERYHVRSIYVNLPALVPFLLLARNYAGLDLGLLFLAHSVGSEYWVKQWIAIAPWLTARDVLLTSTESSKNALMNISDQFQLARRIPLCIAMGNPLHISTCILERTGRNLLCIGRIEDVKNIEWVLSCFYEMRLQASNLHLTIAGEYTGASQEQVESYKQQLEHLVIQLDLGDSVSFTGPVEGARKDDIFQGTDVLINLSTDPGETFGFNLIEAKTWGIPVVCANWDGFSEVVAHGRDGFLVDCHWDQDQPLLQLEQVVHYCLLLLQNDSLRRSFSEQAASASTLYDYKRISPLVVAALQEASSFRVAAMPDAAQIAVTKLSGLTHLYHTEYLQQLSFLQRSPMELASSENMVALSPWMTQVKPIIHHYARRWEGGKP